MIEQIRREITRALAGWRLAFRAAQTGLGLDTRIQRASAEGLAGEQLSDMELFQHFGFTSAPPAGTQLVVIPIGGRTSAAIVVATENGNYRFKLDAEGESALYNQWGDVIHMKQDRTILVKAAAAVNVEAPMCTFSGDVHVAGTLTADVDVIGAGKSLPHHKHTDAQGGFTGEPS